MRLIVHLRELFRFLEETCPRYAVLRNWDHLPDSTGGSDLDLAVDVEVQRRLADYVVGLNDRPGLAGWAIRRSPIHCHIHLCCRETDGSVTGIRIDALTACFAGRGGLLPLGQAIERRVLDGRGFHRVTDADCDLVFVLKKGGDATDIEGVCRLGLAYQLRNLLLRLDRLRRRRYHPVGPGIDVDLFEKLLYQVYHEPKRLYRSRLTARLQGIRENGPIFHRHRAGGEDAAEVIWTAECDFAQSRRRQ